LYGFKANLLDGEPFDFGELRGQVVLVMSAACL